MKIEKIINFIGSWRDTKEVKESEHDGKYFLRGHCLKNMVQTSFMLQESSLKKMFLS